jgi:prevent-host-death family protein
MSTTISARDANQHFAELLAKAAAGETIIITRRGKPVATLAPYRPEAASPERKAAWNELLAMLRGGLRSGLSDDEFTKWKWSRDELYNNEEGNPRGTPKGR